MASLRKALPQREYKERHQPAARERFGLLEKHKDYVLRARDYHKKQDRLNKLRQKAALRNPDEFYFRMTRTGQERAAPAAVETSKYIGYVTMKEISEHKKVEQLQSELQFLGAPVTDRQTQTRTRAEARYERMLEKEKAKKYRELEKRAKRELELRRIRQTLEMKKALQSKGRRRRVRKGDLEHPPLYEWRKERKR